MAPYRQEHHNTRPRDPKDRHSSRSKKTEASRRSSKAKAVESSSRRSKKKISAQVPGDGSYGGNEGGPKERPETAHGDGDGVGDEYESVPRDVISGTDAADPTMYSEGYASALPPSPTSSLDADNGSYGWEPSSTENQRATRLDWIQAVEYNNHTMQAGDPSRNDDILRNVGHHFPSTSEQTSYYPPLQFDKADSWQRGANNGYRDDFGASPSYELPQNCRYHGQC